MVPESLATASAGQPFSPLDQPRALIALVRVRLSSDVRPLPFSHPHAEGALRDRAAALVGRCGGLSPQYSHSLISASKTWLRVRALPLEAGCVVKPPRLAPAARGDILETSLIGRLACKWCALVASECMAGRARSHGGDGCEKDETLMLVWRSLLGCALSKDCDVAGSHWSSLEGLSFVDLKSSCCR